MNHTQWLTVLGVVAAASAALSQVPGIPAWLKVGSVALAAVCGAACGVLAKGRGDTGVQ